MTRPARGGTRAADARPQRAGRAAAAVHALGASKPVTHRGVTRPPGTGVGVVVQRDEASCSFVLQIDGETMRLGLWWLEAASRGGPATLPLVNVRPVYEGDEPPALLRVGAPAPRAATAAAAATAARAVPKTSTAAAPRPPRAAAAAVAKSTMQSRPSKATTSSSKKVAAAGA